MSPGAAVRDSSERRATILPPRAASTPPLPELPQLASALVVLSGCREEPADVPHRPLYESPVPIELRTAETVRATR